MRKERSESGARVYGRTADTAGAEVKVQAALESPAGPRTWLITGGPSIRFDLPNAKRLIAALTAFVGESESPDESGGPDVELPEVCEEPFRTLLERSAALADEWRDYAATLPDGPAKRRAVGLAATIYVERVLSGLSDPETGNDSAGSRRT